MIKLRGIRRLYRSGRTVAALDGIDLEIPSGSLMAVMGPSGSGKSTLLNLLGGLDRPTEGTIEIDGIEIGALDEEERTRIRREKIGIVFQFFNLLPSLAARENVELPLLLAGIPKKIASERAVETLSLVGLADRASHLPDELSGGERQRVAIARAVVTRPALLLADEPTGNLDSVTSREIMNVIHDVHRQLRTTVVLVTHDEHVAGQCRRIVHLKDGRVDTDSHTPAAAPPAENEPAAR